MVEPAILALPPELSLEIFQNALWVDIEVLYDVSEHPIPRPTTPLTLGAVCRKWRSFVWGTPSLWTIIVMQFFNEPCTEKLAILELWLRNSRTYPLELLFHVPRDYQFIDYKSVLAALQILVDESPRWRKVQLSLINDKEYFQVLRQVTGRVPNLQFGHLYLTEYEAEIVKKIDMFKNAPSLKGFAISELNINDIKLPLKQLTSFSGQNLEENDCIWLLSECRNLIECSFHGTTTDVQLEDGGTIYMPYLVALSITDTPAVETMLQRIECPALRKLHLSKQQFDFYPTDRFSDLPFLQINDFISRSGCTLEDLLVGQVSKLSSILPLLEVQPSLRNLTLKCGWCFHGDIPNNLCSGDADMSICIHSDTDSFFHVLLTKMDLAMTAMAPPFLPNLEKLRCKVPFPLPGSPSLPTAVNLLNVLQQRWNPPIGIAKLQELVVEDTLMLSESQDRDVMEGLRELVRRGMGISVPGLSF